MTINKAQGQTLKVTGLDLQQPNFAHGMLYVALSERNERGHLLVEFAMSNQLAIKNTMFQKHLRRLYTWTSPDGKTKNQIDYIMIEKRWSSSIQNVTTKRDAGCDTDHELLFLVATLKIRLKCKKKTDLPIRYNVQNISQDFKLK